MDHEPGKPGESDLSLKLREKIRDMQRNRWEGESIRVRRRTVGRVAGYKIMTRKGC